MLKPLDKGLPNRVSQAIPVLAVASRNWPDKGLPNRVSQAIPVLEPLRRVHPRKSSAARSSTCPRTRPTKSPGVAAAAPALGARGRNTRGYIGPIGDDIPSLIPIIVGLVLFFSAFAFALNEFNLRTQSFAADRDTLIIANSLKGSNYISQYAPFDNACKGLRVRGLHYVAGVVENSAWQTILSTASTDPTRLTGIAQNFYRITNDPAQTLKCSLGENEFTQELLQSRSYVVLTFPLALEKPEAVVSATLVVVAWRI